MRASRLLSILMLLQARGHATAQELATDCEVSLRTIYRDVDALSAAGVPVYADRGAAGGYRLLDGYRTRLNGLSPQEVSALFLSGLPGPAAALGMGSAMVAAHLKLAVALPAGLRDAAARMRQRFHLDAPGWFHAAEEPAQLQHIAAALWQDRQIEVEYTSWKAERRRRLSPLGVVLKGGAWYLVGAPAHAAPRTYRIARMQSVVVLNDPAATPPDFDLAAYWQAGTQRLESDLYHSQATIRLSPTGMRLLDHFITPFQRARSDIGEPDRQGWCVVTLPVGSLWQACSDVLRFGTEAEILAPPALRAKMAEIAAALLRRHSTAADAA